VNPVAEFAWRQGDLAYVREPLGSVVDDLNRYWRARIVIEDPQVADLQFTGTVFVASLTDWLAGIEQAYPVTAWHAKNGEVALRWRR
jgi:transmembrane sensor